MKKLIDKHELRRLLIASERLARLEAAGVDNWSGYYLAMTKNHAYETDFWDWVDDGVNQRLAKYPDYQSKELDNYNFD